jgi:hypothetical protein
MPVYADDNFGVWKMEDPDDIEFYRHVQENSIETTCQGCGRTVKLMPGYAYCDSCARKREQGYDI